MTQSSEAIASSGPDEVVERYLDLLAKTLTRYEMDSRYKQADPSRLRQPARYVWDFAQAMLKRGNLTLVREVDWDYSMREDGRDWPGEAETMVGLKRLANLRYCIETILREQIAGDVLEAGVWRGGASIFMRGVMTALNATDRHLWVADSFEGLPAADTHTYAADGKIAFERYAYLAVSLEEVRANFERYSLLDSNVHFLKGWFKDTMPSAPVPALSLLRLDGDMYESTIQVLDAMYKKVSIGGFVIIDDYYALPECKMAVTDFRRTHGISDQIERIDWAGVYWRKGRVAAGEKGAY